MTWIIVVHYLARQGESRVAKAVTHRRSATVDGKDGCQSWWAPEGGL